MNEQSTFDAEYAVIERINDHVLITDDTQAIDLLLPHYGLSTHRGIALGASFDFKTLRLNRIDDRSMVASDLSFVPGDHREILPQLGAEYDAPYMPIDLIEDEPVVLGRDPQYNLNHLDILADARVSRRHIKLTPSLGEKGLMLAIRDSGSMNGSSLLVHEHPSEPQHTKLSYLPFQ